MVVLNPGPDNAATQEAPHENGDVDVGPEQHTDGEPSTCLKSPFEKTHILPYNSFNDMSKLDEYSCRVV